jgi:hypothetical protein
LATCPLRQKSPQTHCPKCGSAAFSLNKGKRIPTRADYRYLYKVSIAVFLVAVFTAVIFLNLSEKGDKSGSKKEGYQKISLIKIKTGQNSEEENTVRPLKKQEGPKDDEFAKLNGMGINAYNEADYDKAFIYFFQAYSINKSSETVKRNLYNTLIAKGSVNLSQKQFDEALKNFEKGLDYVDDDHSAYQGIGLSYFGIGDYKNALDNLLTAYEFNKNDDGLKLAIAKIYYNKENYEDSKKFIDLIEDKERYSAQINIYLKLADQNITDIKDKVKTKSSHFKVYYDGYKDPVAGNLVSMILEELYFSIGRELNHYPPEKVTAILYTKEQFNENISIPDWAGAIFDGKIKLPAGGIKNRSNKLKEVLAHEYTHAVIFSKLNSLKVNSNCPTWLNEGLAQILSAKEEPGKETIAFIVRNNFLPDLLTLESSFLKMSARDAKIAYIISTLFTQDIIKTFTINSVNTFLDRLSEGINSRTAFLDTFYTDIDEFYKKFLNELKAKYG